MSTDGPRWMPMDVWRSGDHYVLALDLPGIDPGSVDVSVDGNTLSVRAERSPRTDDIQWLAQERVHGSFLRQVNLGDGLDLDRVSASYDAGVLTITVPLAEQAKPRRIEVTTSQRGTSVPVEGKQQTQLTSS
ncbi:MAG: Hsp20/alpha crystallin family protein [Actinomycetales bacterium]